MEKHGQAIGGIKSQMKILRERELKLESQNADLDTRMNNQESKVNMIMLSQFIFYAILITGYFLR